MSELITPPAVETPPATPVAVTPAAPAEPFPLLGRVKEAFGEEFPDDNAFFDHYAQTREKAVKVPEYERSIEELKGKAVDFAAPGVEETHKYVQQLKAKGISDPKEINAAVREWVNESFTDYNDMAEKNPVRVLEIATRRKYEQLGGLSPAQVERMVKAEAKAPVEPSLADFAGKDDPDYIAAMEQWEMDSAMLIVKAKGMAADLEGAKPKLDFTPKGTMTREQQAQLQSEYAAEYNQAITIESVKIGGMDVPVKMDAQFGDTTFGKIVENWCSNPEAFVETLLKQGGRYSPVKITNLLATLMHGAQATEAAKRQGASDTHVQTVNGLANPSVPGGPKAPAPGNKGPVTDPAEQARIILGR